MVTSESVLELLLHLTVTPEPRVNKDATRALAILGENDELGFFVWIFLMTGCGGSSCDFWSIAKCGEN